MLNLSCILRLVLYTPKTQVELRTALTTWAATGPQLRLSVRRVEMLNGDLQRPGQYRRTGDPIKLVRTELLYGKHI